MSFKKITVAGGGVLGSQIAYQIAFKGFDTTVWLRSEASIGRAKPKFENLKNRYLATLDAMKKDKTIHVGGFSNKEFLTDEEIDKLKEDAISAFNNIKYTTSYEEAARDCDYMIESIAEVPDEKIAFYSEMAKYLPEKTVLATNSSTLLPSKFAEYTGRSEKYLAMHFANEIWLFNTAEIMVQQKTDPKYALMVKEFAIEMGMIPFMLKKEQPAYILNTLLVPWLNSGLMLAATGVADEYDIDKCWEIAVGAPAGPFKILDKVGLTTAYNIASMRPDSKVEGSISNQVVKYLKEHIDAGKKFYEN